MQFYELTRRIIGCAYRVCNRMGFGYLESVYEKCLVMEFDKEQLRFAGQKSISVKYDGKAVGEFVADFVVEDSVIVERKSVIPFGARA